VFARELSRQLGARGWRSVLCFLSEPPEPVRRFLELPNVAIEELPDSWKLHWRPARDLFGLLRRHRPEILHLHFTGFLGPYPWVARAAGVRQVLFTDQLSRPEGYHPRPAALARRLLARIVNAPLDVVTTASDYGLRCWVESRLLPAGRFVRIYNGVDMGRAPSGAARFRRRFSIPPGRPLVVQVSWVIPEKGFEDLLEAARLVVARNPNAHFAFVGEGARRREYTERAAAMGLASHVTWTGLLEDPVGEGVYAEADIVCQVSRWEEIFGYVIAEAMAAGKPVIGTRAGGIPEVIEDGVTGFLVERRDPPAIADRILRLLADSGLRESMGQAGRAAAQAKFNVETKVAELLRLYRLSG
jgi:glycosyltransferase involved in cell wall biosynthesis